MKVNDIFEKENIQKLADLLLQKKQSLAVAESVTGGFVQAALSTAEYASYFFQGGITAYNINQKYTHLHIDLANAAATNCVSEQTAREMALGVAKIFHSDWGAGITGYSSPIPGHDTTELYAWYAIVFEQTHIFSDRITTSVKDPIQVQLEYTNILIRQLLARVAVLNASSSLEV